MIEGQKLLIPFTGVADPFHFIICHFYPTFGGFFIRPESDPDPFH